MKKITFLLFTLCATTFFAQNKLTSSLDESFDGAIWTAANKVEFTYDDNNNLSEETTLAWRVGTSQWEKLNVTSYIYNESNKFVEELYQEFDGAIAEMKNKAKNTYGPEGDLIQVIEQDYINLIWVNREKIAIEYADGRIASAIISEWNGSAWILGDNSFKLIMNYNANGTNSSMTNYFWEGDWVKVERTVLSYDVNNWVTSEVTENLDGSTWLVENKKEYTYNANGNALTVKRFSYDDGDFILENEEINTFDTAQLMADFIHPFKDITGVDYLFSINGKINKIFSTTSSDSRTTYNYGESTASIPGFNLANVQVHPNPATDILNVSIQNGLIFKIDVYNLLGKKLFTSTKTKINLESLVKGVYLLKIRSEDGGFITKKLVKN